MYFLITYLNEDQMKNEGAKVVTLYSYIFDAQGGGANSEVGGRMWPKIELIQVFMVDLVTCKNEEDPLKMNALEWSRHISHCKSLQIFPDPR